MFTKNESSLDRLIRAILGVVLLIVSVYFVGTVQIIIFVIAAIALITAIVGFCPLYKILGISTKK